MPTIRYGHLSPPGITPGQHAITVLLNFLGHQGAPGAASASCAFSATALAASAPSASRTCRPASSSTGTPSESALSYLLPALSPATTKSVFFDTDDATLPPRPVISSLASSLVRPGRVPVSTTVTPASGRASAPPPGRSSASTTPAARHLSTIATCQSTLNQSI